MAWMFEEGVKVLRQHVKAAFSAGLDTRDLVVLLEYMCDLQEEAGEVTTIKTVLEIRATTGLSYDQVQRSLKKLKDLGMISRMQTVRRAGEAALTTVLPAAFVATGLPDPSGSSRPQPKLPGELAELLCGQPWSVVEAVRNAWENYTLIGAEIEAELRGSAMTQERIRRLLTRRHEEAMADLQVSINKAEALEQLTTKGLDVIETADGPVTVSVREFENSTPVSVPWHFVKDTLADFHIRSPGKLTKANLHERIAEVAYARIALPFVKDKPWSDGVRLLSRQLSVNWKKPHRIWDSWYECAARVIHRGAACA